MKKKARPSVMIEELDDDSDGITSAETANLSKTISCLREREARVWYELRLRSRLDRWENRLPGVDDD
jgi:hypothetical protein